MNNELYSFVRQSLERGLERDAIREVLLQAGWQDAEIGNALAAFADIDFPVPVPRRKPYIQAREAFLYLVSFIALYVTAFSFGTLVFGLIEQAFPDPLSIGGRFSTRGLATAVASIIVTFPLYLFLMWKLATEAAADPERRQSRLRKWLTYLTLVVAAGIIIGDLIALLSNLLGGELTTRFALKGLTILIITTCIFGFYLWDLKQSERTEHTIKALLGTKVFLATIVIVVAASVGYGIFLLGSPGEQRLIRFDQRRVSDLDNIARTIDAYWETNEELPKSLEDLSDPRYFVRAIEDPDTGETYDYRVLGEAEYELCAVFSTDSTQYAEGYRRRFSTKAWEHGVGEKCFQLEAQSPAKAPFEEVPSRPAPAPAP